MRKRRIAGQELEVLQYISEHAPVSVREVADGYGDQKGLARTTVLTIMERLRKKGFLIRKKREGVFAYSPASDKKEFMQDIVHDFFEKTLKGSLSPFVAYLGEKKNLSDSEIKELEKLVKELKKGDR